MKRQQYLVAGTGVLVLLALYFFGNTVPPHHKTTAAMADVAGAPPGKSVGLQEILQAYQARLTPAQLSYVDRLQQSVVRGDVQSQQLNVDRRLADFWKDTVNDGCIL